MDYRMRSAPCRKELVYLEKKSGNSEFYSRRNGLLVYGV